MAFSALQIPVPELESVVRPRLERRSPDWIGDQPDDTHAHVTLLSPFASGEDLTEGLRSELREFFSDVTAFTFALTSVCTFPGGTIYLAPEPAAPFRALTHELFRRFPEYPPYGGEFDEIVPHLSIPMPEGDDPDQLRFLLGPRLPITAQAREAALFWYEAGGTRTLESFAFGTSAA
jgi:2'-5' RNA ligase